MNAHNDMNTIIHDALRRDLDRLEVAVAEPVPEGRRQALCDHCVWVLDVLHHHHVGEDEGVWPRVLGKRPELQQMVDEMEAEHETLAAASEGLRAALQAYAADGSDTSREAVADAVRTMKGATLPHLEHEEREAMPLVLETLDESDWKYLEKHHFNKGVSFGEQAMQGMWLLDGLDERRTNVVQSLVPAPILWFMKKRYGPRYRAAAELAWGQAA